MDTITMRSHTKGSDTPLGAAIILLTLLRVNLIGWAPQLSATATLSMRVAFGQDLKDRKLTMRKCIMTERGLQCISRRAEEEVSIYIYI